ncbi:MAG: 3'(2'),5'-bisphosphate nucleotidase CysQ [Hyphomicrobium sp.]|nr:3'(2'),5'-bisphosphate nucleotidase CysQ [Hyphomicrobium sp.]
MMTSGSFFDCDSLGRALLPAVLEAGRLELAHLSSGVVIEHKADKSPVTIADREAEAIIVASLAMAMPNVPVVAEEAAADGRLPAPSQRFFLVDALDGTRLFIRGKPEFSVNIALIDNGRPVFGLIYAPAFARLYMTKSDRLSYVSALQPDAPDDVIAAPPWRQLVSRAPDFDNLTAFNSRTASGASGELLKALGVADSRPLGSSLKFCHLAAGEGDLYVRFGDTFEWDTAAGQAILEAAGGTVTGIDGAALTYGHANRRYLNPHFVAWGRQPLFNRLAKSA